MGYQDRTYASRGLGGFQLTTWVKRLMIANVAVFVVLMLLPAGTGRWLALHPALIVTRPWTVFTYMFVHGGFWHLVLNCLALFFFGPPVEAAWGPREFIKYYLICGLGGALLSFVFAFNSSVVGASGAVYGVMLAFAMMYPDSPIYIYAIFPVKAKWLVLILAVFSLYAAFTGSDGGVAHFAHLGGFAAGYVYLKLDFRARGGWKQLKRMVNRPKLTVVSGAPPQRQAPQAPRSRARVPDPRVYDDVDKVLDKISTKGMASLTPEELKLLDEVSRRYRNN